MWISEHNIRESALFKITVKITGTLLCALIVFGYPTNSYSQAVIVDDYERNAGPIRKLMAKEAKDQALRIGRADNPIAQKLRLSPLPGQSTRRINGNGGGGGAGSGGGEENDTTDTRIGMNQDTKFEALFPPITGIRQMADSEAFLKVYKSLITTKVPVMGQTFYMVENGAATGYFQGLNLTSNVLENMISSQVLQEKILEIARPPMKQKWADAIYTRSKERNSWTGGLLEAVGDGDSDALPQIAPLDQVQPNPYGMESPSDRGTGQGGGAGNVTPTTATERKLLKDEIFAQHKLEKEDQQKDYPNLEMPAVVNEVIKYVGDLELKINNEADNTRDQGAGGVNRKYKLKYVAGEVDNMTNLSGMRRLAWEETRVVWEGWHKLLHELCTFKRQNPNRDKKMGELDTVATFKSQEMSKAWEKVSTPSIPMNMDMVLMGLRLFEKQNRASRLDCDELNDAQNGQGENMPSSLEDLEGSKLDDCKDGKGCLRNRLYLYIAHILGRARAIHMFRTYHHITYDFASTDDQRSHLDHLWQKAIGDFSFDEELLQNEQRWYELVNFMGQITQENIGTGGLRPNVNQNLNRSSGAPEVGNQ
jgi:hypothetical protein